MYGKPIGFQDILSKECGKSGDASNIVNTLKRNKIITYGDLAKAYFVFTKENGDVGYSKFFRNFKDFGEKKVDILFAHLHKVKFDKSYNLASKISNSNL